MIFKYLGSESGLGITFIFITLASILEIFAGILISWLNVTVARPSLETDLSLVSSFGASSFSFLFDNLVSLPETIFIIGGGKASTYILKVYVD